MLTFNERVEQGRLYAVIRYVETGDVEEPFEAYATHELTKKEATTLFNALYLADGLYCVKLVKEGWDEDELIKIKEATE